MTLIPGLAFTVTGKGEGLAAIGSFMTLGSMPDFPATVLCHGNGALATA
jgi:hypothetical protein